MFQTNVVEEVKTHFVCNNFLFFEKVPFEIKWKNIWTGNRWQYGTCIACWILTATDTHSHNI